MRKLSLLLACALLCSASPALADLLSNGGFETGDFSGWSLDYGVRDYASTTIHWGQSSNGQAGIWTSSSTMPGQSLDVNPYNGSYMAKIGDVYGNYDYAATKVWQQGSLSQADIDAGGTLYVNWGAALVEPSNTHPEGAQPYFGITVSKNGTTAYNYEVNALEHDASWTNAGYLDGTIWYKNGTWSCDLGSFSVGDTILVELFVVDCGWGGHGSYAFLDGIGTDYEPPVVPLPAGFILGSLGLSFAGWRLRKTA